MVYFSKYASVNIFIYPSFNITNIVNDRCISTFMVAKSRFINKFKFKFKNIFPENDQYYLDIIS